MRWKWLNAGVVVGMTVGMTGGTIASLSHPALAQVIEDNTLGAESSQVIRNVQIRGVDSDRIQGGARRGQNLGVAESGHDGLRDRHLSEFEVVK